MERNLKDEGALIISIVDWLNFMKVGILTFHHVYNYGALLQVYALQKAIAGLSHEPVIIDVHPFPACSPIWRTGWGLKNGAFIRRIPAKLGEYKKHLKFDRFRNQHLFLTQQYNTLKDALRSESAFDALVVGSDQIWNSKYSEKSLRLYLLADACALPILKISYAACCGNPDQSIESFNGSREFINHFTSVSVRNLFTKQFIERLGVYHSNIVTDPTLLINWERAFSSKPLMQLPSQYIFVYGFNKLTSEIVLKLKNELHYPIVAVGMENQHEMKNADFMIHDAGPKEWLGLIKNASFVCTKSFHGMLLSMKYERQFIGVIEKPPGMFRLKDAAHRYGVSNRLVACVEDISKNNLLKSPIDYRRVSRKIEDHCKESMDFLKKALKFAT